MSATRFAKTAGLLSLLLLALNLGALASAAADDPEIGSLNRQERLEWFRDQGFGLFIHWSVDSQLGVVISHSLAGASDDYTERFFTELPKTFNPDKFYPWIGRAGETRRNQVRRLHRQAPLRIRHVGHQDDQVQHPPHALPSRHHQGHLEAFREQGIAPGLYFSPDDFTGYENGITIDRRPESAAPQPGLLALDQAQVNELLTNYGPIDVMFFDGPEGLRDKAWNCSPISW